MVQAGGAEPRFLTATTQYPGIDRLTVGGNFVLNNADATGHLAYNVTEWSNYWRNSRFSNEFYRSNGTFTGNHPTIDIGDGGEVVRALNFYSKFNVFIACEEMPTGELIRGGSGSHQPLKQWDKQRRIKAKYLADNGVPYVAPYVADVPYPTQIAKFKTTINTDDVLNSGLNVLTSSTTEGAYDLPESVKELLIELGEITP